MKILIIQTAFIGDLILTTSFIREVFKKYGNAELHIIVNKGTEDILNANPFLKKIIPFDKKLVKKSIFYFFQFINGLKKEKYDLCISPHFSHRSSLLSFFSGAKKRIGYRESGFSFLHTDKIARVLTGKHETEKLFSLIHSDTSNFPISERRPELYFEENRIAKIREDLNSKKLNKNFVIIAPSSVWETKRMPASKFSELLKLILEKTKLPVIFIGSPAEVKLPESILNDDLLKDKTGILAERVHNYAGKTNLVELSYLISRASAIVSNDSSPIHIASAFNIPTIMIYGATVTDFGYSTLSDKTFISEVNGLKCRPCGIHGGNNCPEKHFKCMQDQSIQKMFQELLNLLS